MRLSDFSQEKRAEETSSGSQAGQYEDIMSKYNSLKGLSSNELYQRLLDEVARQKREGTFNYGQLEGAVEALRSMLPPDTYCNMKRILDTFK